MRTYRFEEMTDEQREEIAAANRQHLRAWLAQGNHCIHCGVIAYCVAPGCRCEHRAGVPAETIGLGRYDYEYVGQICDACRADHDEDPDAWMEFGDHPDGAANWEREEKLILADLDTDAQGMADAIAKTIDPSIPF